MVFANAAARTTALSSVLAEGMVSYLKDTDALEIYSGSAWVGYGSGDITGVTAGTGISGGGTSGTVTITNSMATEITAAGDIIVGTGSGTFDNLPIGTTGQILTADTTVSPYKVKWAAAASGGMTLLSTTTLSGTTDINVSSGYQDLYITVSGQTATANYDPYLRINGSSATNYYATGTNGRSTSVNNSMVDSIFNAVMGMNSHLSSDANNFWFSIIRNYDSSTQFKSMDMVESYVDNGSVVQLGATKGVWRSTAQVTSLRFLTNTGSYNGGTVKIWGVK
jgi:hypothetical protein